MTWLKNSDTAINNPIVLAPLAWEREDGWPVSDGNLSVLLFGLVQLCATHSAGQGTDYVVSDGTVAAMARSSDWRLLARLAQRAGYWQRLATDDGWLLTDDSEHLFHIRLKAEVQWERDRKADVGNTGLVAPVRLRDGDGCRYCGNIVSWRDRHTRGATYDHRVPGRKARSSDDLVVACRTCNSTRGDNPDALPLLPPPARPYYGPDTVEFLANAGITVALSTERPPTRTIPDPAPSDPAPSGTTPTATPHPAGPRATRPDPAQPALSTQDESDGRPKHRAQRAVMPTAPAAQQDKTRTSHSTESADTRDTASGDPGSGRDGTGRAPTRTTDPRQTSDNDRDPQTPPDRRRRRRGRRGNSRSGDPT